MARTASETLELLNRRHSAESKQFAQARSAATRARLAGGTKAWNDWAAAMLGLKAEVEHLPSALEFWRHLARVDLAGEIFSKKNSDFSGLLFPGPVDFSHASFPVDAWFSAAHFNDTADFSGTTFDQDGFFEQAEFCKTARFDRARWSGDAQFRKSKFHRDATFRDARFDSHAWFIGSSFGGALSFAASQFAGEAGLGQCDYRGPSDFSLVRFRDHAGFGEAHFFSAVRFDSARFRAFGVVSKCALRITCVIRSSSVCRNGQLQKYHSAGRTRRSRSGCEPREASRQSGCLAPHLTALQLAGVTHSGNRYGSIETTS